MLSVVLLDEVLDDASCFEEADCATVGVCVGQSGDSAVGIDGQEPGFFLGVFRDVYGVSLVGEAVGFV